MAVFSYPSHPFVPMQDSREQILQSIRKALTQPTARPFADLAPEPPAFAEEDPDLLLVFAEQFTRLEGRFMYCQSADELARLLKDLCAKKSFVSIYCNEQPWKDLLEQNGVPTQQNDLTGCDASVTGCEALIARTGSMLLSSAQEGGRLASVYAPVHICIAMATQVKADLAEGLSIIENAGPQMASYYCLATGPSRTADIEKTLVVGIHGPKEVYCIVVEAI